MKETVILTKELSGNLSTKNLNDEISEKEETGWEVIKTDITNPAYSTRINTETYPVIMVNMQREKESYR